MWLHPTYITFKNLVQTCSPYLDVHYSFDVQKNIYNPILTLITKTNCQYVSFFFFPFFLRFKNLSLEISIWFSLECFLFLQHGFHIVAALSGRFVTSRKGTKLGIRGCDHQEEDARLYFLILEQYFSWGETQRANYPGRAWLSADGVNFFLMPRSH